MFPLKSVSLSLWCFCEVLKEVLHMPLDFSDIFLLYSFLCAEKNKISKKKFKAQMAKVFLPLKTFNGLMCLPIAQNSSWPSYFFLTGKEVKNLLSDVEEVRKCTFPLVSASVENIFNSVKVLGLNSCRLSIITLHDIFCANPSFLKCLRGPIELETVDR